MMDRADELALRLAPRPSAVLWTGRLLIVTIALFVAALVIAPWTQTTRGTGRVVAYTPVERQQTLQAPVEGRIVRWHVVEGSRVKAGAPIVDLADLDPQIVLRLTQERDAVVARLEAAQSRVEAVTARLGSLSGSRSAGLDAAGHRNTMATARARAAEQALRAAEAAEKTAKLNVERLEALERAGLRSRRDLELAQLDEVRTRTDAERALSTSLAARSEQTALTADRSKIGTDGNASLEDARATKASAQSEIASATAELARIEVKLSRQSTQAVKAPRDGTIMRLLASNDAELLKAGAPLALFVPDTEQRAVELWIDGNDVPLVAAGRQVRLQFEGWPAVQFAGWPSVAVGTFGGVVRLVDSHDDGKGKFRVLVTPSDGETWPSGVFLRQGTRAHGWILLNRVRLGYELWRQFNGFPPVVASDEAAALGKKGWK
ncbi:MAG: HlyD family efflux transporter periplasmic adaptor subunit [Polyangia bacterium]